MYKKGIFLTIVLIGIYLSLLAQNLNGPNKILNDSTLHERFIRNLLEEYELGDRWFFIRIDSMYKLKNNYEVVNMKTLYNVYSSYSTSYNHTQFVQNAFETLMHHKVLARNPNSVLLKGIKINMSIYKKLYRLPKEKFLSTFFASNKTLKAEYNKWLFEIVAVCYTYDIKVLTPLNEKPYYTVLQ